VTLRRFMRCAVLRRSVRVIMMFSPVMLRLR
jgi:hypothetical protein